MRRAEVNLRQAVLNNVADSSLGELRETIVDAIESGEDKTLPGLGVLFEVLWNNCPPKTQGEILQIIHREISP